MPTVLSQYLEDVRENLRLDRVSEKEIISELQTHIEDRLAEMQEAGLSEEEAAKTCVSLLGSAKLVARRIYEAHSQGTWRQAWFASLPHILFGLLFALNWCGIIVQLVMFSLVLATIVYGWQHGKPAWLFPWLSYALVPVVAAGLALLYLPQVWAWLAILIYVPLALWLLCFVTMETIRRDWLFSSLMLLPVPVIASWLITLGVEGQLPRFNLERLYEFAPWLGLSFLALGISVAFFVRLRQRWLKVVALIVSGLLTLTLVGCYAGDKLGLPVFLSIILVAFGLFLIPALFDRRIRYGRQRPIS
jgi:hypothetical protein